ncbi:MAG: helix-turn-helix domain-containing protein [Acetobacteraceae bacterium]|nr:helix-turn-helix domain-containing protein [Acetobacteraceae bacterium]
MGRSGETVKRMMAAGMLPTAASEGRGVPMVLAGEAVDALASRLRRAVPLVEAARLLGISRARARHLAKAGLIRPVQRAASGSWAQWAFDPVEIEDFLKRLAMGVSGPTSCTDTVGFNHVAEAFRRRGVPLDRMVRLILDGDLNVLGIDQRAIGLKRLRFDPASVRRVCRAFENGPTMAIEVAAERLGLKWQVAAHLVHAGLLEARNGRVTRASVERFDVEHVTGAALARERRTSPRSLARKLAAQGILPVVGPGIDGSRQNVYRREEIKSRAKTLFA